MAPGSAQNAVRTDDTRLVLLARGASSDCCSFFAAPEGRPSVARGGAKRKPWNRRAGKGPSPGGATDASVAPPGLDAFRLVALQGFRSLTLASPLATLGRPSGAASRGATSKRASERIDITVAYLADPPARLSGLSYPRATYRSASRRPSIPEQRLGPVGPERPTLVTLTRGAHRTTPRSSR
jgi:hypothetical protein